MIRKREVSRKLADPQTLIKANMYIMCSEFAMSVEVK